MASLDISVVIPTYNRSAIVTRAVASALAATRPGDEVIVVDDGSADDTAAHLLRFGDRIRYVPHRHVGPGAIRNVGIDAATCPLVAFLDSDDEWMRDKLDLQRAVMEGRPDVLFCFSDFAHRSRDGVETRRFLARWHRDQRSWNEILPLAVPFSSLAPLPAGRDDFQVHVGDLYATEMQGDYVCTSTVVVRRIEAGGALRFAEDLWRYQDWACFGRLARAGQAAYLDCETQWNCDHAGDRLTRCDQLYRWTARIEILQRVWGSDHAFLAVHGPQYRAVLADHRRRRARALIGLGRTPEAREELRLAGSASITERVLASLPGRAAQAMVKARELLGRSRA